MYYIWLFKALVHIDNVRLTKIKVSNFPNIFVPHNKVIQNNRRGMLSSGIVLIHDNTQPHTAVVPQKLLRQFRWEVFNYPAYSPNLAPNDFHLFWEWRQIWEDSTFVPTKIFKTSWRPVSTRWQQSSMNYFYEQSSTVRVNSLSAITILK